MKANELRIGNLINEGQSVTEICGRTIRHTPIGLHKTTSLRLPNLKPIPLTEEWFNKSEPPHDKLKSGNIYRYYTHYNGGIYIDYMITEQGAWVILEGKSSLRQNDRVNIKHIENVHEWQNIHYQLTGEELTFKES